jgi:small-conductance mechanosensitive channel
VGWIGAFVIVIAGVLATRRLANGFGGVLARSSIGAAGSGAGLRLLLLIIGYLIVIFSVFAVLGVSLTHLLLGAGLAGIILGIAAQQSLGNIFASLVLLVARPFVVGDRIRIRSGVLAGPLDATVLAIDLAYVTVQTDDGVLKIPNAVMLGSGIGKPSADGPPSTS